MEMTTARLLTGFAWNCLGVSQCRWLTLIQIASLGGVYLVSFMVAWLSASLLCVALSWSTPRHLSPLLVQALPPFLALAGVLAFGAQRLATAEKPRGQLRIALIQPAIPQLAIWDTNERTNRLRKLLELSRAALATGPELVVWPETAMPELVTRNRFTQETIVELLRPYHSWMVLGASDFGPNRWPTNSPEIEWYNGAFLLNPAGEMAAVYHKRHLVPFGEFMPGASFFPLLGKFRTAGAGLASGKRDVSFQILEPRARFPILICYEDVFPHEVRRRVDAEADLLLNLTNNGWFGESAAQWQHAMAALFRAVELGLPLVRCANNGLTCWVDAHGRLHDAYFNGSKNIYQAGYKIVQIPLTGGESSRHPTLYRRFGDWFGWGCFAIIISAGLNRLARRFRSHGA
jgi:apolipoprotein N-acyltransferase